MASVLDLDLGPFQLEPETGTLWVAGEARRLRPKAVQVLRYLASQPGRVVSAEELLQAVWNDVHVGRGALKVHVWEIRRAIGESGRPARFLETLPRRGYRWIAGPNRPGRQRSVASASTGGHRIFVGRDADLRRLGEQLDRALSGSRQVILIGGDPGIGKTALVQAFLGRTFERAGLALAIGTCLEQHAGGEAYLPLLSALGYLARGNDRARLARVLQREAPNWLALLPSLAGRASSPATGSGSASASADPRTRPRLLREIAEALERLTARRGLLLVLEDLHWADPATLDFLSFVARRPGRARLAVIATHRPLDAGSPLASVVDDLSSHQLATRLTLDLWGEVEVEAYVAARLAVLDLERDDTRRLSLALYERTEGNPLFAVNAMDEVFAEMTSGSSTSSLDPSRAAKRLREIVPESVEQMIAARVDALALDDRRFLEAASAVGVDAPAAAVAAALEIPVVDAEERGARLARGSSFLSLGDAAAWADGTIADQITFRHSLYRDVLYERIPAALRRRMHERIALRLEAGISHRESEVSSEIARHFAAAGRTDDAIRQLEHAATVALERHAEEGAVQSLSHALELLASLPETPDRTRRELTLQLRLGAPLLMTRGYGAPEVVRTYARALELSASAGDSPERLMALVGVFRFSLVRSELTRARDLAGQAVALAERTGLPLAHLVAQFMRGMAGVGSGDFATARDGLERSLALYDPVQHGFLALTYGDDPGVGCLAELAMVLWFIGFPDQALERSEAALARAREVGIPYSLAFALNYAIWSRVLRGEAQSALAHADELVKLARANDFAYWVAQGTAIRGWVWIDCGRIERGIAELEAGLAGYEALGADVMRPWHLGKLAQAHARAGRIERARATVARAVQEMQSKEERFYEAELLRIQGELAASTTREDGEGNSPPTAIGRGRAEELLRQAIAVTRRQGARSLELRAVTSLARLLSADRAARADARSILAETLARFDEGAGTGDHTAARAALRLLERA